MYMKPLFLSAALALAAPLAASAATITAFDGATDTFSGNLLPGSQVTYDFALDGTYTVYLSLAVSGQKNDVADVSYGFEEHDFFFSNATSVGPIFSASATYTFTTSDDFTFGFYDGVDAPVGTTLTYYFEAVPTVPVPAAGALLLSALAGLGVAKRRKKA